MFSTMMMALLMLSWTSAVGPEKSMLITKESERTDYAEFGKFQMFIRVAHKYMTANPTASGDIYWATIKTSAPPSAQTVPMPDTWKIVSTGATYVICTEFASRRAANMPGQLVEDKGVKLVQVPSGKIVVGDPAAGETALETEAAKCS
jgi:hypothetical protein